MPHVKELPENLREMRKPQSNIGKKDRSSMNETAAQSQVAPLQIGRDVVNILPICAYARALGVKVEDPSDLHVTLIWSRKPVNWSLPVFQPRDFPVIITPDQVTLGTLGDLAVLLIESAALTSRQDKMRAAGAGSDWESYIAHITLGKVPAGGLSEIEPFNEIITLGHEYRKPAKLETSPKKERA